MQVSKKFYNYVEPEKKKGRHSIEYQPFMSVSVARRGIEPLISRMKTWRPNRLDERAIAFWECKITKCIEFCKTFLLPDFIQRF
jgi:hypothetical protein